MILTTIWFEYSSDFISWQKQKSRNIISVSMTSIGSIPSPMSGGNDRPRLATCVVYELEE